MDELIVKKEDGVAVLTINRADKMNALTMEMAAGLREFVTDARDDDDVKVLVLTGTGRAFCAGADVGKALGTGANGEQPVRRRQEILEPVGYLGSVIHHVTKPIIGAINGTAAGAGLSLALLCDIRIASDQARFGAAWVKIGLIPDVGASWLLPRIVGMDRALEMMFTGDLVDASEAARVGLVTRVVPHGEVLDVSMALAKRLAQMPSISLDFIKRGAYRGLYNTFDEQLDFESYAQNVCRGTEDHREGVRAFQEKRPPVFRGR